MIYELIIDASDYCIGTKDATINDYVKVIFCQELIILMCLNFELSRHAKRILATLWQNVEIQRELKKF